MKHSWIRSFVVAVGVCAFTPPGAFAQQPVFDVQPVDATLCASEPAIFTVQVDFLDGQDPAIQWQFDGVDLMNGDREGRVSIVTDLTDPSAATSVLTIDDTEPEVDAGQYDCIADTSNNGQTVSSPANLTFHDPASVDPTAENDELCVGDNTQLAANVGGPDPPNQGVIWIILSGPNTSGFQFSSSKDPNPVFTPTDAGTYVLQAETFDPICQVIAAETLTLEVYQALGVSPTPAESSACVETEVPLSANPTGGDGNYEFTWTIVAQPAGSTSFFLPDASAENPTFTPTTVGDYELAVSVNVLDGSGIACSTSAPGDVSLTVVDTLGTSPSADADEICFGGNTIVLANATPPNGVLTYGWSIVEPSPNLDPTQFSDATAADPVFTPAATGLYTLEVIVSGGTCEPAVGQIDITVHDAVGAEPSATPATVCADHPSQLLGNAVGSGQYQYNWSVLSGPDDDFTQFSDVDVADPTFTPSLTGTYVLSVVVDDAVCDDSVTETVELAVVDTLSSAPTPVESSVCIETPVQLFANPEGGGGNYEFDWTIEQGPDADPNQFDDPSVQDPTFTPDAVTTEGNEYVLQVVVSSDGCDDAEAETVMLAVAAEIDVAATALEPEICIGAGTLVTADAGGGEVTYSWSIVAGSPDTDGAQFSNTGVSTPFFTPFSSGVYTLRVDVESGSCMGSDTVDVTVHDSLSAEPAVAPETVCLGDDAQLTVEPGGSGIANQIIIWSVTSGPDLCDEQFSDIEAPDPLFTPSNVTSPGNLYVLSVEVVDLICGELVTGDVELTVNALVSAAPAVDPTTACEGIPVQLSANPDGGDESYVFTWSVAAGPPDPPSQFDDIHAEDPMFTPAVGPTTYTLALVVDDEVCDSTEEVYFLELPVTAPLSVEPSAEFDWGVLGQSMTLLANGLGGNEPVFHWNVAALPPGCDADDPLGDPDISDPTFTPNCLGEYTLTVSAVDGVCDDALDSLVVDTIDYVAAPSADPATICDGVSTVLSPNVTDGFGPYLYTWSILEPDPDPEQLDDPTAENPVFTPNVVGIYMIEVTVEDEAGALPTISGSFDLPVSVEAPTIDAGGQPESQTICVGESAGFSVAASGDDLTYQWRKDGIDVVDETTTGLTFDAVSFDDSGDYDCAVSNGCGTVVSDVATLTVEPPPDLPTLLSVTRWDTLVREVITGCTIDGEVIDAGDLLDPVQKATGLATDPISGTLYAAVRIDSGSQTHLATVDLITGQASIIGTMGEAVSDLAFHPDGTLYAILGNNSNARGQIVTVDPADATLTFTAIPPFDNVNEGGHAITFDETGLLYHHGRDFDFYARLSAVDPDLPDQVTVLFDYGPQTVAWTSMIILDDLFLVATQNPPELLSIDRTTYQATVLGPVTPESGATIWLTGMAFVDTGAAAVTATMSVEVLPPAVEPPTVDDILRITATVTNVDAPLTGAAFVAEIDADTTVVPQSVTTTLGTVVSEDPIQVTIGSLDSGESVVISFDVTVNHGIPIDASACHQGTITADLIKAVLTDDPGVPGSVDPTCLSLCGAGDFDCDNALDLDDFQVFQSCALGPSQPPLFEECVTFDFDFDDDVDALDWGIFQARFTGPPPP